MIIMIAVAAGILAGLFIPYDLTSSTLPYVAIALLAAIDSVFGGISAYLKHTFNINIFMTGFFSNAILAALLTYVGDMLGINISFAAVIVFGTRIFGNLANIRHYMVDRMIHREQYSKRKYRKDARMLAIEGGYDEYDDTYYDEEEYKEDISDDFEDAADSAGDNEKDSETDKNE